jgi:hypothetical protein
MKLLIGIFILIPLAIILLPISLPVIAVLSVMLAAALAVMIVILKALLPFIIGGLAFFVGIRIAVYCFNQKPSPVPPPLPAPTILKKLKGERFNFTTQKWEQINFMTSDHRVAGSSPAGCKLVSEPIGRQLKPSH